LNSYSQVGVLGVQLGSGGVSRLIVLVLGELEMGEDLLLAEDLEKIVGRL